MNISRESFACHQPLLYPVRPIDKLFGRILLEGCEHLLSVKTLGADNLRTTHDHLQTDSAVLTFNHASSLDIPFLYEQVLRHLDANVATGPAAAKFFEDPYNGIHADGEITNEILNDARAIHRESRSLFEGRIVSALTELRGVHPVPLVQHYLLGEGEIKDFNIVFDTSMLGQLGEALLAPGTVIGMAPEGTRSKAGVLQEAQCGISVLFRNKKNRDRVLVQPIALIGLASIYKPKRRLENPLGKVKLIIGPSYLYADAAQDAHLHHISLHHAIMCRLAALLPADLHGYYDTPRYHPYIDELQQRKEYVALLRGASVLPRSGEIYHKK